ncbi:hypothetical protein CDL15_Pgr009014 [Punica granatum]|uniref:Uncharacterized protein n=1 Tax=Punica granatum TaxID=22663 RepID=A0A218VXZ2_PUNGR|nr:hypothetical protein CDL15_Pgr009014 [Punica granatum]
MSLIIVDKRQLGLNTIAGQATVVGTIVCVGGAMLLSFYRSPDVEGNSPIYWKFTEKMTGTKTKDDSSNISGPFFCLASSAA